MIVHGNFSLIINNNKFSNYQNYIKLCRIRPLTNGRLEETCVWDPKRITIIELWKWNFQKQDVEKM